MDPIILELGVNARQKLVLVSVFCFRPCPCSEEHSGHTLYEALLCMFLIYQEEMVKHNCAQQLSLLTMGF